MRLTLDQLRTLLVVARVGGVHRAAQELHLTQPAITARIRNLEQTLGVELFDRKAAMKLTKSGSALVGYAEQFLKLNDLIIRDVARADGVELLFRIGVSETIVQAWLPEFIARLRAAYPKVTVEIDVDVSRTLRDRLLGNQIDLALLMGPVSDFRVENIVLPAFPMGWFRVRTKGAPPVDLSGGPVITFARDTRPFRRLKETLLELYGPEAVIFPSSSLSACFRMVAAGLGVGALPLALAEPHIRAGEIERFDPGWVPEALEFTASYVATPEGALGARAAAIAADVAADFDKKDLSKSS
ncbi:MAG: LysR family transcriptional regulator [Pseudomonadota bacterium]